MNESKPSKSKLEECFNNFVYQYTQHKRYNIFSILLLDKDTGIKKFLMATNDNSTWKNTLKECCITNNIEIGLHDLIVTNRHTILAESNKLLTYEELVSKYPELLL